MKKDFLDVELDREKTRTSAPEHAVRIVPFEMDSSYDIIITTEDILTPNELRELSGLDKMKG
jgi:hypothetical protein